MKGVRIAVMLLTVTTIAMPAGAQDTNFLGTWRLDREGSEFPEFGGGGFGGRRGGLGGGAATLVIVQSAEVLIIERQTERGSRVVTYRLDGRESTHTGPRGELTTTSSWEGGTLVTEGTQELSTPRGNFSIDLVERRTLADDGQTLTVESTRTTRRGDISATLVYRK